MTVARRPRVLVSVEPKVLDDLVIRLLEEADAYELVREVRPGSTVDAAILTDPGAGPADVRVLVLLPEPLGAEGVGSVVTGGSVELVHFSDWADVLRILEAHLANDAPAAT